jgi:cyclic pyranopterin phosphate synthase
VLLQVGSTRRTWLELALDDRCNLRCVGCHGCRDTERLTSIEAAAILRDGVRQGLDRLWLGGGEPTLRDDLLALIREARRLGYSQVVVQTNGLRLAYPKYRDALLAAGVTELRLNVKSHRAEVHDRLSRGASHGLLLQAIEGLAGAPVRLVADVLLTRSAAAELPETVAFYAARGVRAFVLWLLSAADSAEPEVIAEVPRIADLHPALAGAYDAAKRLGASLSSLHTPPCTLPPSLRVLASSAADLALVVVGPDKRPFALEDSPFEGGALTAACGSCAARRSCGGPRADYVALHGDGEFVGIA